MSIIKFGPFIFERRSAMNLSAKEIAQTAGCHVSFIRGIERGVQFPSQTMARNILESLDVNYKELDPVTLEIEDGKRFKFNATVKGQNNHPTYENVSKRKIMELMYSIDIYDNDEPRQLLFEGEDGDVALVIFRTLLKMVTWQGNKREGDAVILTLYCDSEDKILEQYKRTKHDLHDPKSSQ